MTTPKPTPQQTATNLITLLNTRGQGDYIGESISQLEHCLQCANFGLQAGTSFPLTLHSLVLNQLTNNPGAPQDTILAGLLHDIGQFLPLDEAKDVQMGIAGESVGRVGHEAIGASYLTSLGFAPSVTKLVGSHVAAKRYPLPPSPPLSLPPSNPHTQISHSRRILLL
jgi:predicted HD phosphohydrolase